MLFTGKRNCGDLKEIALFLLKVLFFVSIVGIVIILTKVTHDVTKLRNWKSEENFTVTTDSKRSISNKILKLVNSTTSQTNRSVIASRLLINQEDYDSDESDENDDLSDSDENYIAHVTEIHLTSNKPIERTNKICKPEPPRDDFRKCGNRVADRKCCEYTWAMKYKKELLERHNCITDGFKVIGGLKVSRGGFPHMAAVGYKHLKKLKTYVFNCGGILVSESFVLTAGHCTKWVTQNEYEQEPYLVRLGVENIMLESKSDFRIKDIIKHPNYKPPEIYYDIALLKLKKEVVFTYTIHPACLSTNLFPQIKRANVTGWGVTQKGSKVGSSHLLMATMDIVNHNECNRKYKRFNKSIRLHQICAVSRSGAVDTCQGDSGGPLQELINSLPFGNIHRVYGVVSFGYRCATFNMPGIYTRIAAVMSWIENTVWPEYKNNSRKFGVI